MDKEKFLKIAIIIASVGVITLAILLNFMKLNQTPIMTIDESYLGKTVLINSTISSSSTFNNKTMFYVDNNKISFIAFSELNLKKGDKVLVTGKVAEYKDGLQIIVDKIQVSP